MAKSYLPVDRDQPFLLPPDMREWLPADHVVWLVIEAVGRLDTSAFPARRRTGGAGAAGGGPGLGTVARFRQRFAETAASLFAQVLALCARLGMGQVGVVALDGTKIAA